eukprot:10740169-Heterocapsa_arctica.AAC.1
MGMRIAAPAAKRGPAPANLGHGPCAHERPHGTWLWDHRLHGWVSGFSQRPPHAQSRVRSLVGKPQPGKLC